MEQQIKKLRNIYVEAKKYIDEKYIIFDKHNDDKVTISLEDPKIIERLPRLLLELFNYTGKNIVFSNNWNIQHYSNLIEDIDDDMIKLIYGYRLETDDYDMKYYVYYIPLEKKCVIFCIDRGDYCSWRRGQNMNYQYLIRIFPKEKRYNFEEIMEIFSNNKYLPGNKINIIYL